MALLDHKCGYCLTNKTRGFLCCLELEVGCHTELSFKLAFTGLPLCMSMSACDWCTRSNAMACRAKAACPCMDENVQSFDGRCGSPIQDAMDFRHSCNVTAQSTRGIPTYPYAAPPSRVVRDKEVPKRLLEEKGTAQVSSMYQVTLLVHIHHKVR